MDRTTIMLPPELKTRASNQAKKMRISLGQYIREALKKSLEMENRREAEDDPLFLDSAVFDEGSLRLLVEKMGEDRVVFGTDYPFPLGEQPMGRLVRETSVISEQAKQKILADNAADFFNIQMNSGQMNSGNP